MAKLVKEYLLNKFSAVDINESIDETIDRFLKEKIRAVREGYSDVRVDHETWNDYIEIQIYGSRLETDAEEALRIKREEERERQNLKSELEKYEELKKKFADFNKGKVV